MKDNLIIIIIILSAILILLHNQIGSIISRVLGKIFILDKISSHFLSSDLKKYFKNIDALKKSKKEDLKTLTKKLVTKYGKHYKKERNNETKKLIEHFPSGLQKFFENYDYLDFEKGNSKILDIALFSTKKFGGICYCVIGADIHENLTFLTNITNSHDEFIYGIDTVDKNEDYNNIEKIYDSFEHFLSCYYVALVD